MLIVCPNCATSYDVDAASLRPDGRRVRCVRCRTVWHAEIPHREKLLAAAQALAPVRRAVEAVAEIAAQGPELAAEEAASVAAGGADYPVGEEPPHDASADMPSTDADEAADPAEADAAAIEVESPPIAPADAEAESPPLGFEADASDALFSEPLEDIESLAARRHPRPAKRQRWRWPLSPLQSAIMVLIVADAIIVGWRTDLVRAMPQTASFYAWLRMPVNLRGLEFDGLNTTTEQHDGVPILVIGGNIVNDTGKTETVPHLRFAVRNAAHEEMYSWSAVPPVSVLQSGQAVAFHTRLASPPPDSHDVFVRFVNRYDIMAGTR